MKRSIKKNQTRARRAHSIRGHLKGFARRPRLSVYRSNQNLYAQVIDDSLGKTVASAKLSEIKAVKSKVPGARVDRAVELGKIVAERAIKQGVKTVVFDRGRYAYHGQVRALAEGARAGGLQF